MFLKWISQGELLPTNAESHILNAYPKAYARSLCKTALTYFAECEHIPTVLSTPSHIQWNMEIIGHVFTLEMEDSKIITHALDIYEMWLNLRDLQSSVDESPPCMVSLQQPFIQEMIGHMSLLFEERPGDSTVSDVHFALCQRVLDLYVRLSRFRGGELSLDTWAFLMRVLVGVTDSLLHGNKGLLGTRICSQVIRVTIEVFIRSLGIAPPMAELWKILTKFFRRWFHKRRVVEQWNVAASTLSRLILLSLYENDAQRPNAGRSRRAFKIIWADHYTSSFTLKDAGISYAWYKVLHLIGHPSHITDPDVHATIVSGLGRIIDCIMSIGSPRGHFTGGDSWERVRDALSSASSTNGKTGMQESTADLSDISYSASNLFAVRDEEAPQCPQYRAGQRSVPDTNSILRILGPWLFDAALNRPSEFILGQASALSYLGRLLCDHGGGNSKTLALPHVNRFLQAIKRALSSSSQERAIAAVIYSCTGIFGSNGVFTFPGNGILVFYFHRAVARILRVSLTSHSRTLGGVPVYLLNRASLWICGSLISYHQIAPDNSLKKMEKEYLPERLQKEATKRISDLPRYSPMDVVDLILATVRVEAEMTNVEICIWVACCALQQTFSLWSKKKADGATPFDLLISVMSAELKSSNSRWTPRVLMTVLHCLVQMSTLACKWSSGNVKAAAVVIESISVFIENKIKNRNSNNTTTSTNSQVDIMLYAAFKCLSHWLIAVPLVLHRRGTAARLASIAASGSDLRLSNSIRISVQNGCRLAARELLHLLLRHTMTFPVDGVSQKSSLLLEKYFMDHIKIDSILCFALNEDCLMTVVEIPSKGTSKMSTVLILRDPTGRYSWKMDMGDVQESVVGQKNIETPSSITCPPVDIKDPLLGVLRSSSSLLTSWCTGKGSHHPEGVIPGEGNTNSIRDLVVRFGEFSASDKSPKESAAVSGTDLSFIDLMKNQVHLEKAAKEKPKLVFEKCQPPTKMDVTTLPLNTSRRMLIKTGLLSLSNWGALTPLRLSRNLFDDIYAIDAIPEREVTHLAILYMTSKNSAGGCDLVQFIHGDTIPTSRAYAQFLASIGTIVDADKHSTSDEHAGNVILHFANAMEQVYFKVPTMCVSPKVVTMHDVLKGNEVTIIWNAGQHQFHPTAHQWTSMDLPNPKTGVFIIIEPIQSHLFRVRILHDENTVMFSTPYLNVADEVENNVKEDLLKHRILGPLQSGMVIHGNYLSLLVRQTALNAVAYARQCSLTSSTSQSRRSIYLRHKGISAIIKDHSSAVLPGQFYKTFFPGTQDSKTSV